MSEFGILFAEALGLPVSMAALLAKKVWETAYAAGCMSMVMK